MSPDIVLHYLSALAYLLLGGSICLLLLRDQELPTKSKWRHYALLLVLILHGIAIHLALLNPDHLDINWSLSLSFTMWLGVIVFWLECNFISAHNMLLPLSLPATLACLLAALFPVSENNINIVIQSEVFRIHLVTSLFAYGLIALATIQAIIVALLDRYLHRPHDFNLRPGLIMRLLDSQPPLLAQERILFRLIWVGFSLLTISMITGMWVSMKANGYPLPADHKTFFTFIAWVVFAFLLTGRTLWGWRGRLALRWTLTGFALLMLAYTGTHFVLEVILNR